MTAAGSSRAASPNSSQASSKSPPQPRSAWPLPCRHWPSMATSIQHLRSGPGVWLMLGVAVVLVGMSVAVAGYVSSSSSTAAAPRAVGGRGGSHPERMKLAGPMVMGAGLFIFICAATLLYENRDRRQHLQRNSPSDPEDLKEDSPAQLPAQLPTQLPARSSADAERGSSRCRGEDTPGPSWEPLPFPEEEGGRQGGRREREEEEGKQEEEDEREGRSTLLACVVHHQEPVYPCPFPGLSPSPCPSAACSARDSDSCNSSEINLNIRTGSPLPATDGDQGPDQRAHL